MRERGQPECKSAPLKARATPVPHVMQWPGGTPSFEIALDASHAGWRLDRALADSVPTPVARAAEGADQVGRADPRRRQRGARPGDQGQGRRDASPSPSPPPPPAHNEPQEIALGIVYEDEHLLVVDKPAGLVVHPAAGNRDGTMVNALLHHCGGSLSGIGGVARPGIVHRIDKDTSGLLVVAKHDLAHEGLARQFADHSIERRYLAIVSGVPRLLEGTVDAPLARSPHDRKKIAIVAATGRRASAR